MKMRGKVIHKFLKKWKGMKPEAGILNSGRDGTVYSGKESR